MPLICGVKQGTRKLPVRLVWNAILWGKGIRGVTKAVSLKDDHTFSGRGIGAQHQATEASKCMGLLGCFGEEFFPLKCCRAIG